MAKLLRGRGPKKDLEAQKELYDVRAQNSGAVLRDYVLGLTSPWLDPSAAVTAVTGNLYLFYLGPSTGMRMTKQRVRIHNTTGGTGELRTALYLYDPQKQEFGIIGGSEVSVSDSTTGLIETDLRRPAATQKNQRLFLGVEAFTANVVTYGYGTAANLGIGPLVLATSGATSLAGRVHRRVLTQDFSAPVPAVYYLSSEGADFL